jgi:hypothetical protein
MSADMGDVSGTKARPWVLSTPGGTSGFRAYRDPTLDPPAIVVKTGGTEVSFHLRCLNDLDEMLRAHDDWMPLGVAEEQERAAEGTVEAWARSPKNPIKGWYGLKKGLRGRFAAYIPPIMVTLNLAEIEEDPKNPRMRSV